MAMQGSCKDFCSKLTQMYIVSEVRWFKYTIDKKTTSKLTKARKCKFVSFFLHDTVEGTKGLVS